MNPLLALERWIDVRPGERRAFWLSALGAFIVIGFAITARSLREAFFLDEFSVEKLPYITIATTALSLPAVALFTKLITQHSPDRVYRWLLSVLAVGLTILWAANTYLTTHPAAASTPIGGPVFAGTTIGFYLFTALGTLLLTSGFWVVTSERFELRDAKRLFGPISAGGTIGAMIAGFSVGPMTKYLTNSGAVGSLVVAVLAILLLQRFLPSASGAVATPASDEGTVKEGLALVLSNPHLRTMALIVAVATLASYLVHFEFMAAANIAYETDERLAGFLGRFYGITGMIALGVQMLVAARLLARSGVAVSLAVLPVFLLAGGGFALALPGLLAITLLRGTDASLRKSMHRAVLEFLWVPVPAAIRRRTKTFVDSFVDSAAEGLAAVLVFLWVIVGGLPSAGLLGFVIVFAIALLFLSRSMGRTYFDTVLARLDEGRDSLEQSDQEVVQTQFVGGEFSMTFTQFGATALTQLPSTKPAAPAAALEFAQTGALSRADRLATGDSAVIAATLKSRDPWETRHVPALTRLLARDAFYRRAAAALISVSDCVPQLAGVLLDETADFVIRRRIPRVLASVDATSATDTLMQGLVAHRFEVRYRCAVSLARRRKAGLPWSDSPTADDAIWAAIRTELNRERPIWELQKLLDDQPGQDDFVAGKVYGRGELSLEHTFRLLSLVIDAGPIRTAFHGVVLDDKRLRGISLEYLEQVLPGDVRDTLWPFIGDLSEHRQRRAIRGKKAIVDDLLKTGATLFANPEEQERLRVALKENTEIDS